MSFTCKPTNGIEYLSRFLTKNLFTKRNGTFRERELVSCGQCACFFCRSSSQRSTLSLTRCSTSLLPSGIVSNLMLRLNHTVDIDMDSQVRLYGCLSESPPSKRGGIHVLESENLRRFVGSTKWNTDSPLQLAPTQIVFFLPRQATRPLFISGDGSTLSQSFMIPAWGGVSILNGTDSSGTLSDADHTIVQNSIVMFLRTMLGLEGGPLRVR